MIDQFNDPIMTMTKSEYYKDADAYTENGFHWGYSEGLYVIRELARQRGLFLSNDLFDETLKLRETVYKAVNK